MRHSFFPPKDSHRPERIGAYEKFYKGRKEPFQIILATEHYSKLFQQYGDNGWSRGSLKIMKGAVESTEKKRNVAAFS